MDPRHIAVGDELSIAGNLYIVLEHFLDTIVVRSLDVGSIVERYSHAELYEADADGLLRVTTPTPSRADDPAATTRARSSLISRRLRRLRRGAATALPIARITVADRLAQFDPRVAEITLSIARTYIGVPRQSIADLYRTLRERHRDLEASDTGDADLRLPSLSTFCRVVKSELHRDSIQHDRLRYGVVIADRLRAPPTP